VSVYQLTDKDSFQKEWALRDQIRRSAISIPSNIAEGFERETNKEFARSLWIAKGSAGELRTQLYLAIKTRKALSKDVNPLISNCKRISSQIAKLIQYLQTTFNTQA
jgi:four helix bundle protein